MRWRRYGGLQIALRTLLSMLVLGLTTACGHFKPDEAHGFHDRQVTVDGKTYRYQVYAPRGEKLPVVVFLHGRGEGGRDNLKQTQEGMGPMVWKQNGAFPFIVIFPQIADVDLDFWSLPHVRAMLFAELDQSIAEFHGDPTRVILTGISLGGAGTWLVGATTPGRFAALIPICGTVVGFDDPYVEAAHRLAKMPVWVFHGAKDDLVPVEESRRLVAALKAAGNEARYTEFPDLRHDSWDRAYAMPELWVWAAEQRLTRGSK
jgi:predicted peptidase